LRALVSEKRVLKESLSSLTVLVVRGHMPVGLDAELEAVQLFEKMTAVKFDAEWPFGAGQGEREKRCDRCAKFGTTT
jgi:hypothetical protein